MLKDFVVKLQNELDLKEPLIGDDDSGFAIALDDKVISIMESSPGFKLYCSLGYAPGEQIEEFYTNMLRGNLFGQTTRYSSLGLDETGNNVVVNYHFPLRPAYKDFRNAVEDFINVIDFWKNQIQNHPSPDA